MARRAAGPSAASGSFTPLSAGRTSSPSATCPAHARAAAITCPASPDAIAARVASTARSAKSARSSRHTPAPTKPNPATPTPTVAQPSHAARANWSAREPGKAQRRRAQEQHQAAREQQPARARPARSALARRHQRQRLGKAGVEPRRGRVQHLDARAQVALHSTSASRNTSKSSSPSCGTPLRPPSGRRFGSNSGRL